MSDHELRDAVHELHEYLADRLAPLMVVDSIELLFCEPSSVVASAVCSWAGQQQGSAPASDLLFHCVKKIALLGEFDLIASDRLAAFLGELSEEVLQACPEAEREVLRQNLERLAKGSVAISGGPVELLRPGGHAPVPAPADVSGLLSTAMTVGLRRLGLLLERLQPRAIGAAATPEQRGAVASQFVTAAAREAKDAAELDRHLAPLRQLGLAADTQEVFRTLSRTLSGWGALSAPSGPAVPLGATSELSAMRQIVSLSRDQAESGKRFRELVHAAIEQFNEGHLGRAALMFDLAEQLVAEKKVSPAFADPLRASHEYLRPERMRKYAERQDSRAALLRVLPFFPALRPEGLLRSLDGEPNRDRRHQLLALLEVHGAPARAVARERLRAFVEEGAAMDAFFPMNLIYLLRAIPRPEELPAEEEIQLVSRALGQKSPTPLVKQVIAYLSFTRHEKAERALVTYLRVFETMLLQPETAAYPPAEVEVLLDRTCAALARYGTPRAWKAMVDHGLAAETRLGATLARLAEAGRSQDLSSSPEIVGRLLTALEAELPRGGVLGFGRRNDDRVAFLIQALSGTPTPAVMQALSNLAAKFQGQKIGDEAAKALATLKAAAKPSEQGAGLAGDLELFGLPDVLQTLANSQVTGVLTLMNEVGVAEAAVLFEKGQFRGARYRSIQGPEAVYELFERPFRGTFAFVARRDHLEGDGLLPAGGLMDLIFEGVRRHDELKRASTIVPDGAVLKPTGQAWASPPDENTEFATQLWALVAEGAPVERCEGRWAADSYRIRRLLAHWVEQGALVLSAIASAQGGAPAASGGPAATGARPAAGAS